MDNCTGCRLQGGWYIALNFRITEKDVPIAHMKRLHNAKCHLLSGAEQLFWGSSSSCLNTWLGASQLAAKGILKRAENVQGPIKLSKDGASPLEDLGQGLVGDVRWWSIPYLVLSTVLKSKIQNSTFKTLILKGFLKFRFPSIKNFENTSVNLKGQKEGYLGHYF